MPKRCTAVLQDNRTGMDREVEQIQIATSGSGPPRIAPATGPDSPHRFAIGREVDPRTTTSESEGTDTIFECTVHGPMTDGIELEDEESFWPAASCFVLPSRNGENWAWFEGWFFRSGYEVLRSGRPFNAKAYVVGHNGANRVPV